MAFSTQRGRPRNPVNDNDCGTPELRLKHALNLTREPVDLCLEKGLITAEQHWCALHLRWLYTLRYGAPSLTRNYTDRIDSPYPPGGEDDPAWRTLREAEYHAATALLTACRRYEPVMRLAVFNELPSFLNPALSARAFREPLLAEELSRNLRHLSEGLTLLTVHWQRHPHTCDR